MAYQHARAMPTTPPVASDPKIDAQVFWIKHHKEIAVLVVGAVLAAIALAGYRFYSERTNSAAATFLASAKTAEDYQSVIAKYANTSAGASAYLMFAQSQRNERKFAESNATLQTFLGKYPKHELAPAARLATAANFESMGRKDEALSLYQQVAEMDAPREESMIDQVTHLFVKPAPPPKNYDASLALISQVRLLKDKNQIEAARKVCETILLQYSDSFWAAEAMRELRQLTPSEPPAAARSTSPSAPAMLARPPAAPAPSSAPTANPAKKPN